VPLSRQDVGALTALGCAVCLMFGFFGFAVAIPWATAVMPVSQAMQQCPGSIEAVASYQPDTTLVRLSRRH